MNLNPASNCRFFFRSPPASQAAAESIAGDAPAGAEEQQATEAPAAENAATDTNARQEKIFSVPENTGLLPEIAAAAELTKTELPVPTSLKEQADFTQKRPSSSSQLLAETEMAEICQDFRRSVKCQEESA